MLREDLQKAVDYGVPGTDILHGYLKEMAVEAEQQLLYATEAEMESGEAMDSMERKYWEGIEETVAHIQSLVIDLTYAINERAKTK